MNEQRFFNKKQEREHIEMDRLSHDGKTLRRAENEKERKLKRLTEAAKRYGFM